MGPVLAPALQEELQAILDLQLADNCKAWELAADGDWRRSAPAPGEERRPSQQALMARALARAI
jgi:polyphosphate kinase